MVTSRTAPRLTPGPGLPALPWLGHAWAASMGCFVLAAGTGVLFRLGLVWGLPPGLAFDRLRHAHSHLMYLGWVTPWLFALMAALLSSTTGRPLRRPGMARAIVGATVVTALLAYGLFAAFGYEAVPVGGARVPLAAAASSLSIVLWYAFIAWYRGETAGLPRPAPSSGAAMARRLWATALAMMAVASLGAWGRAALGAAGVTDPFWQDAAVHLFLDVFSDGWMVLALLGVGQLLHGRPDAPPSPWARWGLALAAAGIPLAFLVGVPLWRVPAPARMVAGAGSLAAGVGLLVLTADLWRRSRPDPIWRLALAALGIKAVASAVVAWPGVAIWVERWNLRILYLHLLLLGGVTLGLVATASALGMPVPARRTRRFAAAVALVLASLVPLTGLWPGPLRGPWGLHGAAWAALVAWVGAMGLWLPSFSPSPRGVPRAEGPGACGSST